MWRFQNEALADGRELRFTLYRVARLATFSHVLHG